MNQSAQHSPETHIKSHSDAYSSTVLHTGTRNKAWHTAQENLTDMLFHFLRERKEKKKTRGQEKAYLLNVREKKNKTNKGTKKRCIKKS